MPIRSHVDPCTFVVFIHVHGAMLEPELDEIVQALDARQGDAFSPILDRLHPRMRQLVFHETYHYWQGIRLPFLFRYSFLSFQRAMQAFGALSRHTTDYLDWACQIPELERLSVEWQLGLSRNGKIAFGPTIEGVQPLPQRLVRISALLLLETAATLAEYSVSSVGDRGDPATFRRWCKRNPGYLDIFNACAFYFDDERLALRCLLPLINACFHTSKPERAFAELLARTWGRLARAGQESERFLAQPEPCRWPELFRIWLGELKFDLEPKSAQLLEDSFYRLDLESWVGARFGGKDGVEHPFIGPAARRWLEMATVDDSLSAIMDFPGMVSDETFELCMHEFQPTFLFTDFTPKLVKTEFSFLGICVIDLMCQYHLRKASIVPS